MQWHRLPIVWRVRARSALLSATLLALAVAALAGCRGKDRAARDSVETPDCAAVGDALTRVTMARLDGLSERQKTLLQAQQHLIKEQTVATCEDEAWPPLVRTCMAQAAGIEAFNQCTAPLRQTKGLPPPASLTAPAPGSADPPAR